jgi:hypothetical protein
MFASQTNRMRVLLTRKLADVIDGIDLSSRKIGDVFDLSGTEGRLLVAERWAIQERRSADRPRRWPPKSGSTTTESRNSAPYPLQKRRKGVRGTRPP